MWSLARAAGWLGSFALIAILLGVENRLHVGFRQGHQDGDFGEGVACFAESSDRTSCLRFVAGFLGVRMQNEIGAGRVVRTVG